MRATNPALTPQEAERLVNTYADLILRLSYTYLKNTQDAQDICQTVFLKFMEKPRTFRSPEYEKAWIIRAAVLALTVTAGAAGGLTTVAEALAGLFGSSPAQTEVIDHIGYPIGPATRTTVSPSPPTPSWRIATAMPWSIPWSGRTARRCLKGWRTP